MKGINIFALWRNFWFQQQPATAIAIFRICYGLFVLQLLLTELLPNFSAFYSIRGMIDTATVSTYWWLNNPIFDIFLLIPQNDNCRLALIWLFVIFAFMLMIGFCTRLSAIIVFLGLLSLQRECPFILHAGDDLMRILGFLLIFSYAGSTYSIDALLKAKKYKLSATNVPLLIVPIWPQRMIQIQISIAYFYAFLCKIVGQQWQEGMAAYYASQLDQFKKFPLPWITDHFPGYQFLTYYTLFAEFAMAILVWIKPLRYWALLVGLCMHAGIDWTMNLPCFEWLFVSSYILFVEPQDLNRVIKLGKDYFYKIFRRYIRPEHQTKTTINSDIPPFDQKRETFVFLSLLLIIAISLATGVFAEQHLREHWRLVEFRRSYERRLIKTEDRWQTRLTKYAHLPDDDSRKLTAQEALATLFSLEERYPQAVELLRHICQERSKQKEPYNFPLIRALSTLGNIYIETGHLAASELCYQTIYDYDWAHMQYAGSRLATDSNNLGVLAYFRALTSENKLSQWLELQEADKLFSRALDELDLSNLPVSGQPGTMPKTKILAARKANILSNQYLCLRDSCRVKESRQAQGEAEKLRKPF